VRLGTTLRKATWVDCGYTSAVWGEDATLSHGFSCGISRTWD
jgi:hypothetical protein